MQTLEEINTFQTQLDDLAKGVNRIRYLKQKIQNSLGTLKPIQSFRDNSSSAKFFNASTTRLQTQSGNRNKQLFILQSDRFQTDQSKSSKPSDLSNTHRNFYKESKNGIFRQKWNDSFVSPIQQKKMNETYRHENPSKLETFYSKSLMKNIDCPKNEQISLQQLKKINYISIKKQRKELKMKINQQKQNRTKQVLLRKQKIQMAQRMAKKKNEGFVLQKMSDLRTRKQADKQQKAKLITAKLQNQMELEDKEAQRLKNLQKAVLIKFNMRKIIEQQFNKVKQKIFESQSEVQAQQKIHGESENEKKHVPGDGSEFGKATSVYQEANIQQVVKFCEQEN